ncbi:Cyclin-L2 [Taenia crassiceps]|uniref:Cyclin-L2 n=1 Tax=Taenia crassiceps TaxID=6207 RepID=A0ABR4QCW4_9CEST
MANSEWAYAGVHLSIDNYVIPQEKLFPTPSNLDGLDAETEFDLRYIGCELIQDAGTLLRLPQVAMATAQVLYQRYFYSKSFHYAMACIFLAAKIEECPRRIREVINVFHHMKQAREGRPFTPVLFDQAYVNLKRHIIKAERRVLKELGFCVHGKHPHKLIIMYLKSLSFENNKEFVQTSWNCMNDVLRTDVFVRHTPEAVACACIFLAARRLGIPLPRHPPWWEMFNVDDESVHEIALCLQRLYAREKPSVSALELRLAEVRKRQAEEREAAAAVAAAAAAAAVSNKNTDALNTESPGTKSERAVSNGVKSKSSPSAPISETIHAEVSAPSESVKRPSDGTNGVTMTEAKEPKLLNSRPPERRRPSAYSEMDSKSRKTNKTHTRSRSPVSRHNKSKVRRHRHSSTSASITSYSEDSLSPGRPSDVRKSSVCKLRHRETHRKRSRSPYNDDEARSLSQVVQLPQQFLPSRSPAHVGFGYMIFKGLLEGFIHDTPFTILRPTGAAG